MPSSERMRSTWRRSAGSARPSRALAHLDGLAGDRHHAFVRRLEQIDAAQKRALARAGRAEDRDHVAVVRGQRHALQHFELAEALVHRCRR